MKCRAQEREIGSAAWKQLPNAFGSPIDVLQNRSKLVEKQVR
jgi:hypothetical protein